MANENYIMSESPVYNEEIRKLKNSDPANAETVFNPLIQEILENIHYLKLYNERKVIASRVRDPSKPAFDITNEKVVLDVGASTGTSGVSVNIDGVAYDAANIALDSENASNGSIIIRELEG